MFNVIFSGFYCNTLRKVITNICRQTKVGYINVVYYKKTLKDLRAEEKQFVQYHALLNMDQTLFDPNDLIPLDEELIVKMSNCERIVLKMIDRLEVRRKYTYKQRIEMYYYYLRYWNTVIEAHRVNLFISANVPHEIFDYVIYGLCKLKKIPVIFLYHQSQIEDTALIMHDWKENCLKLKSRFKELKEHFNGKNADGIDLPDKLQCHFNAQISDSADAVPFYMTSQRNWRARLRFIINPVRSFYCTCIEEPKALLRIFNPFKWIYLIYFILIVVVRRIISIYYNFYYYNFYYRRHSIHPDLNHVYIYIPLQYQPELSTSPLADAYADQQLIVQMVSKYLPEDVYLYVKEHPKQTSFCRSIKFYEEMAQTKNVVLVRKDCNSFNLIKHCVAVATSTGTPGWEALFREKPVLMFGSYIYQFADGVYKIKTNADCRHALDQILNHRAKPSLKNMKLYLKALGEVSFPAVIDPDYLQVSKLGKKENIANITRALLAEINHIKARHGN